MAANLAHGKQLHKKEEFLDNGRSIEIVPIEGNYEFPLYSSVNGMIEYGRKLGIAPGLWPVYYDSISTMENDEVYCRCQKLKLAISKLNNDELQGNSWLKKVSEWLDSGESFCVTE